MQMAEDWKRRISGCLPYGKQSKPKTRHFRSARIRRGCERRAVRVTNPQNDIRRRCWQIDSIPFILGVLVLAYTLIFSRIAYDRFRNFSDVHPEDTAAHSQYIWNTAHGRFLQQTVLYIGGPDHLYLALAIIAPIYRVSNDMFAPLFLYTLVLASGALPVYLLAKDRLGSRHWALLIGIFYLLYPGTHYLNLQGLKPNILSVSPLLFSFYFWQAKKLRWFLVSLLLASLVTEVVSFFILMYAPLSWIKKREKRWVLGPLLIAVATLTICHLIFVPLVSGGYFHGIKDHRFFHHIYLFSWRSYKHIFDFMGLAVGFLFLSWEAFVLAIPYLSFGTLTKHLQTHYYYPLAIILWIALIYGLERIKKWRESKGLTGPPHKMMLVVALVLLGFVFCDPLLVRPKSYHRPMSRSAADAWSLIQKIPEGASVTCDTILLPALSLREAL